MRLLDEAVDDASVRDAALCHFFLFWVAPLLTAVGAVMSIAGIILFYRWCPPVVLTKLPSRDPTKIRVLPERSSCKLASFVKVNMFENLN